MTSFHFDRDFAQSNKRPFWAAMSKRIFCGDASLKSLFICRQWVRAF